MKRKKTSNPRSTLTDTKLPHGLINTPNLSTNHFFTLRLTYNATSTLSTYKYYLMRWSVMSESNLGGSSKILTLKLVNFHLRGGGG